MLLPPIKKRFLPRSVQYDRCSFGAYTLPMFSGVACFEPIQHVT